MPGACWGRRGQFDLNVVPEEQDFFIFLFFCAHSSCAPVKCIYCRFYFIFNYYYLFLMELFILTMILNLLASVTEHCFVSVNLWIDSALRHRHLISAKCILECRMVDTHAKIQYFKRKWIANFIAWRCVKITARAIMLIRQLINTAWVLFNHCQSQLEIFAWFTTTAIHVCTVYVKFIVSMCVCLI